MHENVWMLKKTVNDIGNIFQDCAAVPVGIEFRPSPVIFTSKTSALQFLADFEKRYPQFTGVYQPYAVVIIDHATLEYDLSMASG